jgi:hypothetical protein
MKTVGFVAAFVLATALAGAQPATGPSTRPERTTDDVWQEWKDLQIGMSLDDAAYIMKGWKMQTGAKFEDETEYDFLHQETAGGRGSRTVTLSASQPAHAHGVGRQR